jgi:dipeptidyl aminopeptidase/acylaminoacyl peptidase
VRTRLLLVFSLLSLLAPAVAQNKRPFTFEDMMKLKRVGEPVPSPDGRWVLFSVVDVDLAANTRKPHIWIVPLDPTRGTARQLTNDPAGEDRPRWAPDGKHFAFLTSKSGSQQVWIAEFNSENVQLGASHQLTNISTEADGEQWSPDGGNIIFVSGVYPECSVPEGKPSNVAFGVAREPADEDSCNKNRDEAQAKNPVKAMTFTRLFYRHWKTYFGGKRSHLFVVAADAQQPQIGRDLTPGDHDVPPFSLGGQDDYAISPDGQEVAFTSNIEEVEATSTNNDIFIVPITGGTPKNITAANKASDSTPLYSPDGRYIAYRAQFRPGYESDRFRLLLYERKTGKITNLTENFDRWVGSIAWQPNSKILLFSAEDAGESPIYKISLTGDVHKFILGHNDDLTITADGRNVLFTRMSAGFPNEIYAFSAVGAEAPADRNTPTALSRINDSLLSQIAMSPLEPFWFTGSENAKVEGFLIKPPNFDAARKYPVKFLIHGGPQGAWGDSWSYRWNAELFAANGYVVIMVNPRGSTGYGQKFIDDINGDWGGRAYQDLMLGLDYAEKSYPFIDKDRECALGASFGGYMAYWIEGHSNRFKCIVAHDGMFNTESAYGTTEELWFPEWEFKGTPWNNLAMYRKWSPHLSAANFKTPLLVVHGQLDYRLDVSEGFQAFTTLQRLKVPSKMLYFPDEGHWVLKPKNSQLWYQTVNDWVDQWTKPSSH